MKIVIYGKPRCSFCTAAKNLCETRKFDYEYKLLDADYTAEELFKLVPTAKTFPQIFINDHPIGGYAQFYELVNQGAG